MNEEASLPYEEDRTPRMTGPEEDPDVFGRALRHCWQNGAAPGTFMEMVERDDGYLIYTDLARYFAPAADWDPVERLLCEWAHGKVVDIGCGAGRHALELMGRGLSVTGVEPSPGAAAIAEERGVGVVRSTVSEFVAGTTTSYDCLLFGGFNLGLLGNRRSGRALLTSLRSIVSPGATLLGSSSDPKMRTAAVHQRYVEENLHQGRMPGQDRIRVRHWGRSTRWFDYLYLSGEEVEDLASGTGWSVTRIADQGLSYAVELTASP